MKASVGDRIMVASNAVDRPVRDGRVVEVRHPDGSPPYLVEWADTGQTGLVFPGPDARVEHVPEPGAGAAAAPGGGRSVKTWRVEIEVVESGADTTAHAVLVSEAPGSLGAEGRAHRNPVDRDMPVVGDEVAVARALHRLADGLLGAASGDISAAEGHRVVLRS